MPAYGTYEVIDGQPALRFERKLAHSVERVWLAVTEPAELAHWFPHPMTIEMRPGGRVTFASDGGMPDMDGEVKEIDPPHLFAFTWGDDLLRFELEPVDGSGCVLRFTHLLTDADRGAMTAAGWTVCLEELEKHLDGKPAQAPGGEATDRWRKLYEEYQERGVPAGAPIPSS